MDEKRLTRSMARGRAALQESDMPISESPTTPRRPRRGIKQGTGSSSTRAKSIADGSLESDISGSGSTTPAPFLNIGPLHVGGLPELDNSAVTGTETPILAPKNCRDAATPDCENIIKAKQAVTFTETPILAPMNCRDAATPDHKNIIKADQVASGETPVLAAGVPPGIGKDHPGFVFGHIPIHCPEEGIQEMVRAVTPIVMPSETTKGGSEGYRKNFMQMGSDVLLEQLGRFKYHNDLLLEEKTRFRHETEREIERLKSLLDEESARANQYEEMWLETMSSRMSHSGAPMFKEVLGDHLSLFNFKDYIFFGKELVSACLSELLYDVTYSRRIANGQFLRLPVPFLQSMYADNNYIYELYPRNLKRKACANSWFTTHPEEILRVRINRKVYDMDVSRIRTTKCDCDTNLAKFTDPEIFYRAILMAGCDRCFAGKETINFKLAAISSFGTATPDTKPRVRNPKSRVISASRCHAELMNPHDRPLQFWVSNGFSYVDVIVDGVMPPSSSSTVVFPNQRSSLIRIEFADGAVDLISYSA